jgi:NAD(P)-dependent dehydrogenase (short-subunit alcohol dehydrogenase family)
MVDEFIKLGWIVAGCGRDPQAVAELQQRLNDPHFIQRCDVAKESEVAAFCQSMVATVGVPDLVINNAAVINPNRVLWKMSAEDIDSIVDVNIKGTMAMMRHLLPGMMTQGGGVVVNLSSGWGRSTAAEVAPYCATKWAIEGLSQAVAQETEGKVAIVAMNPGIIDTDMLRSTFGPHAGQYPNARQWAKTAVPFLVSLGRKHNGQSVTAPG